VYGVVVPDQPATFNRVKVSKFCILVNVMVVLTPRYLVCGELLKMKQETPLSELIAQLPSTLLCCLKDLQICVGEEDSVAQPVPGQSTCIPPVPMIPLPNTMAQAQSKPHDDIKEPLVCGDVTELDISPNALDSLYDPHTEQNPADASPDLEGVEHAHALAVQVKASAQTIDLSTAM